MNRFWRSRDLDFGFRTLRTCLKDGESPNGTTPNTTKNRNHAVALPSSSNPTPDHKTQTGERVPRAEIYARPTAITRLDTRAAFDRSYYAIPDVSCEKYPKDTNLV